MGSSASNDISQDIYVKPIIKKNLKFPKTLIYIGIVKEINPNMKDKIFAKYYSNKNIIQLKLKNKTYVFC